MFVHTYPPHKATQQTRAKIIIIIMFKKMLQRKHNRSQVKKRWKRRDGNHNFSFSLPLSSFIFFSNTNTFNLTSRRKNTEEQFCFLSSLKNIINITKWHWQNHNFPIKIINVKGLSIQKEKNPWCLVSHTFIKIFLCSFPDTVHF